MFRLVLVEEVLDEFVFLLFVLVVCFLEWERIDEIVNDDILDWFGLVGGLLIGCKFEGVIVVFFKVI